MNKTQLSVGQDILFPALLVLVYLFTPFRLIQGVLIFWASVRIIALLWSRWEPRFIQIHRTDPVIYINAREQFQIRYSVSNRFVGPLGAVVLRDSVGEFGLDRPTSQYVMLGPRRTVQNQYAAVSQRRGDYEIGPVVAQGWDPTGFYKWEARFDVPVHVVVYPRVRSVLDNPRRGLPSGNLNVENKLYEDPTNFRSVREYVAGDELKRVNWKVSARMGKLYSMEYVPTIYFPVLIALNLTEQDYPLRERFTFSERAIETAASLVFYFVGLKQEVGLIATGSVTTPPIGTERSGEPESPLRATDTGTQTASVRSVHSIPIRSGYGTAIEILKLLARIELTDQPISFVSAVQQTHLPTGAKVLVVTPPVRSDRVSELTAIRRKGHPVQAYVIGSSSTERDRMTVPGIPSIPVTGAQHELVRG